MKNKKQAGFSLVEAIVALCILAIAIAAISTIAYVSLKGSANSDFSEESSETAVTYMSEVRMAIHDQCHSGDSEQKVQQVATAAIRDYGTAEVVIKATETPNLFEVRLNYKNKDNVKKIFYSQVATMP